MDREVPSLFTSFLLLRSNLQQAITSLTPLYDYQSLNNEYDLTASSNRDRLPAWLGHGG
jgi:hypothetical protein